MSYNLGALGYPLKNSFLSLIYSYLLGKNGINGGYNIFRIQEQVELPILMHFLERFSFTGLNVCSPHRQAVIQYMQDVDDTVKATGVVNTASFEKHGWKGYNTIIHGFRHFLETENLDMAGKKIAVFGAGGASRSILYVLQNAGVKEVTVVNRSEKLVEEVRKYLAEARSDQTDLKINYMHFDGLKKELVFDIVLNAAPVDWENKIWLEHFWGASHVILGGHVPAIAIDLQYFADRTPFLNLWGAPVKYNGFTMFVEQAVKSFEIWFGSKPEYSSEELYRAVYGVQRS